MKVCKTGAMNPRYLPYLQAMGIQVWRLRHSLAADAQKSTTLAGVAMPADDEHSTAQSAPLFTEEVLVDHVPSAQTMANSELAKGASRAQQVTAPASGQRHLLALEGEQEQGEENASCTAVPRSAAIAQLDWQALQAAVSACTACQLHTSRTQTVFGVGNRQAQWLIVGEAPGADEDRLGEPFVGRAGKLLDAMLLALKLQRNDVFIANILKCRPPKNRDPLPQEASCCWPFLERQIALLKPSVILAIGRIAAQTLLQTELPVGKLRGRIHRLSGTNIPIIVSYHPAYLLRSPREKRKAWDDLQLAHRTLVAEQATTASQVTE